MKKKMDTQAYQVIKKPKHERLPWPGLKDKERLIRVVTRAVKDARETREREAWAKEQLARVLDQVPPSTTFRLFLQEVRRRRTLIPRAAYKLLDLF